MSKSLIKKASREKIFGYADSGVLTASQIHHIYDAENSKELIEALSKMVDINEVQVWSYIINVHWKGLMSTEDKESVFDKDENIFFRELLRKKGILSKQYCLDNIFKTEYFCEQAVKDLEDMGLIDKIELNNWEVIYMLNLDFYKKVIKQ